MSSDIPKALFSIGVKAPAADARLQSPSASVPGPFSMFENLGSHVFFICLISNNQLEKPFIIMQLSTQKNALRKII